MKGCRPLSDSEVSACLEALGRGPNPSRDRALFMLGLRAGFRISELLSLTLGSVFQNGAFVSQISVERKNMKKKTEGRTVALHSEARELLVVWVKELWSAGLSDPKTFLFKSKKGANKSINRITAWAAFVRAYKACGLTGKLGTHAMRKTFAKKVHEKLGRDLLKTQRALGHARVTSTAAYLSFSQDEIDDAILKS